MKPPKKTSHLVHVDPQPVKGHLFVKLAHVFGPPVERRRVEEIRKVASARPDLSDVEIASDVLEEQALRDSVVVGGVTRFELDARVEDGHEAAALAVQGVDEGSDGLFWVVDGVEGEVLPPNVFLFFRERRERRKGSERRRVFLSLQTGEKEKTLSFLSRAHFSLTCPCSRCRPRLRWIWRNLERRTREREELE